MHFCDGMPLLFLVLLRFSKDCWVLLRIFERTTESHLQTLPLQISNIGELQLGNASACFLHLMEPSSLKCAASRQRFGNLEKMRV